MARLLTSAYERLLWWRALPAFIGHLYKRMEDLEARVSEFDGGDPVPARPDPGRPGVYPG